MDRFDVSSIVATHGAPAVVGGTLAALAAGFVAWYMSPFVTLAFSVAKGYALSIFLGLPEQRLLAFVQKNAEKGNAQAVLDCIDRWCWDGQWMMNIGNRKGEILDQAVKDAQPMNCVELGGYVGYSAIRIGRLLPKGAQLVTLEISPKYARIAEAMILHAGLEKTCRIVVGDSALNIPKLKEITGKDKIDFAFVDHFKTLYLRDLKIMESCDLLKSGSVLVADNVIFPGAPDYLKYVRGLPEVYQSEFHPAQVEYSTITDGVEVTTRK
ncbi:catechol-O-methyltransferase [Capsaspora owczarzaki ATCC 30864]|uniref:catechol O-methyltransferase n=1 Tax=Capsaspora owczarzaki (strain ATCC 30864) TaxID=595528 RepID=A0A0D2VQX6_CAPO3|nr:catechol-O-methyltransferase [Capsaspora owczarzaki ATCC 30864]KJE93187.1 catechol-O-methyltransferase [Capsaspora owczarzaki ATCC 30864]|eukprot:XP_004347837.1 catechol-O-methyltransferase [Capsaspora owczarzaki ATCC 30864]